jgi:hypothetical protein
VISRIPQTTKGWLSGQKIFWRNNISRLSAILR